MSLHYCSRHGKRKYAVEIMNRFRMTDYMTTPRASNMKLLSDASSETVDVLSLDVPDRYETRYFLCCEHIEPIPN